MVRITHELIRDHARQALNPLNERYLSLRGLKIGAIENLGTTSDHFGSLDLSDNSLVKLSGFPPLKRMRCVIAASNRISRFDDDIFSYSLVNIVSLVLTNNAFATLDSLVPLFKAKHLERLTLVGNPVQTNVIPYGEQFANVPKGNELYRLFLIHFIPSLRILDFKRVTAHERKRANSFFTSALGAELLASVCPRAIQVKTGITVDTDMSEMKPETIPEAADGTLTATPTALATAAGRMVTSDMQEKIKGLLASATDLEEISKLENALQTGVLPIGIEIG